MNYFEIVNKCLEELSYKQVNSFAELTKNDHKKIKNIVNIVNSEVCSYDNWNFKLRKTTLELPANTSELENTIEGKIASIVIDGHVYKYFEKPEDFIMQKAPSKTYSSFNDLLLLPEFDEDKTINVIYYTSNAVKQPDGNEKAFFENEGDVSLIPEVFAEPILVYGSCMRLKSNPQHVKFSYWMSMYNTALANMRSRISIDANYTPSVKMQRY